MTASALSATAVLRPMSGVRNASKSRAVDPNPCHAMPCGNLLICTSLRLAVNAFQNVNQCVSVRTTSACSLRFLVSDLCSGGGVG